MKKLVSMMATVAMMGLSAGALAQGGGSDFGSGSAGQGQSGSGGGSYGTGDQGGTGTQGQMGQMGTNQQQVEGKVLKADKNSITIEHMGAAIPLQVQSSTSFQGVKGAKDIKEGQQVRASFELKGSKNNLTSVEVLPSTGTGTGGSMGGSSDQEPFGAGSSGSSGSGGSESGSSGSESGGY